MKKPKVVFSKQASDNKKITTKSITNVHYLGTSCAFQSRTKRKVYFVTSIDANGYYRWVVKGKPKTKAQKKACKYLEKLCDKAATPRCWGWVPTLKEAQLAVKLNSGDMAECCYYTHVVIEELGPGIPNVDVSAKTWWYQWKVDPKDPNKFEGKWVECAKPCWSEHICGWSL
jgi:hypothetical protein